MNYEGIVSWFSTIGLELDKQPTQIDDADYEVHAIPVLLSHLAQMAGVPFLHTSSVPLVAEEQSKKESSEPTEPIECAMANLSLEFADRIAPNDAPLLRIIVDQNCPPGQVRAMHYRSLRMVCSSDVLCNSIIRHLYPHTATFEGGGGKTVAHNGTPDQRAGSRSMLPGTRGRVVCAMQHESDQQHVQFIVVDLSSMLQKLEHFQTEIRCEGAITGVEKDLVGALHRHRQSIARFHAPKSWNGLRCRLAAALRFRKFPGVESFLQSIMVSSMIMPAMYQVRRTYKVKNVEPVQTVELVAYMEPTDLDCIGALLEHRKNVVFHEPFDKYVNSMPTSMQESTAKWSPKQHMQAVSALLCKASSPGGGATRPCANIDDDNFSLSDSDDMATVDASRVLVLSVCSETGATLTHTRLHDHFSPPRNGHSVLALAVGVFVPPVSTQIQTSNCVGSFRILYTHHNAQNRKMRGVCNKMMKEITSNYVTDRRI